jgi:fructokinase
MTNTDHICCFGDVLWDLLPSGKLPGGAPMNVAIHLQNLGIETFIISRIGNDDLGQEIKSFINSKNCSTDLIQIDKTYKTGIVNVTLNAKKEASYDIVQPIAWDFIIPNAANFAAVSAAKAIVFCSLACRNDVSKEALMAFLEADIIKVFDVNFRPPHYSQSLVEELMQQADIVKMNEDEIQIIADWQGIQHLDYHEIMKFLSKKFKLKVIVLTRGENGAAALNETGYFENKGFKVSVADTVGSGDAFLAGFLKNYFDDKPIDYCLNYACAIGAVVAGHHGANPAINETDVFKMMQSGTN